MKSFVKVSLLLLLLWLGQTALVAQEELDKISKIWNSSKGTQSTDEFLTIHMFPHSHDDVGWLKTVDEYYYGSRNDIQRAGVQYTIDSVVDGLLKDPSRHFIFVEIAFFFRWWYQQTPERQQQVKQLVANGQFEFINGGWCMNDEATCYYEDIIDQMTIGHQFLLQTFQVIPNIGWQIDPFGHSSSMAALFAQMGFNAWFFARIDYQDKEKRLEDQSLEMIMHPRQDSKIDNYIFTQVQYRHYGPPPGFCFDYFCSDTPIMDDPTLENYNVQERADDFMSYFRTMSQYFRTNQLAHTFGSDFQYMDAFTWYANLDRLVNYINNNPKRYNAKVMYSTPSIYLREINKLQQVQFPTKSDDFFPYADKAHAYWTGYFTSRVSEKGQVRDTNRYLQAMRTYLSQLKFLNYSSIMNQNEQGYFSTIELLEQEMGVNQHHDGLTGTEKQAVANDYSFLLNNATLYLNSFLFQVLQEQTQMDINEKVNFYHYNWNYSSVEWQLVYSQLKSSNPVLLAIYNPGLTNNYVIKMKVPNVIFEVWGPKDGVATTADVICPNKTDSNNCDLYFVYQFQGYALNYIKLVPTASTTKTNYVKKQKIPFFYLYKTFQITSQKSLKIHKLNNKYTYSFTQGGSQVSQTFQLNYNHYVPNTLIGQHSGAYIFRPAALDTHYHSKKYSSIKSKEIYIGQIVTVLHLKGKYVDSQLKFFNNGQFQDNQIEVESFVDSIPLGTVGKEIVALYEFSGINNYDNNKKLTWYTDSNGLELQERKFNYRPTWDLKVNEPAAGNYYPINAMIQIRDQTSGKTISVLSDRTEGGASLKKGQVELMIHRRLKEDDHRGVGEPLDEKNAWNKKGLVQRVRHWIVFHDNSETQYNERLVQKMQDQTPIIFVAASSTKTIQQSKAPRPVVLDTIPEYLKYYCRYMGNNNYLVRLHNMLEDKSLVYTFSDQVNSTEFTLTGNQLKSNWDRSRMTWNQTSTDYLSQQQPHKQLVEEIANSNQITVQPQQIRAFIVNKNGKQI